MCGGIIMCLCCIQLNRQTSFIEISIETGIQKHLVGLFILLWTTEKRTYSKDIALLGVTLGARWAWRITGSAPRTVRVKHDFVLAVSRKKNSSGAVVYSIVGSKNPYGIRPNVEAETYCSAIAKPSLTFKYAPFVQVDCCKVIYAHVQLSHELRPSDTREVGSHIKSLDKGYCARGCRWGCLRIVPNPECAAIHERTHSSVPRTHARGAQYAGTRRLAVSRYKSWEPPCPSIKATSPIRLANV